MESQAPRVTVEGFDGPLDLLLELVEEKKLDILTVRLGDLADAYLARVRAMAALPADEVSAFLALASRLVLLKARSLLPSLEPILEEEGESEEELRLRLLEYAIVRERAGQLGARLRAGERAFHREGGTVELPPRGDGTAAAGLVPRDRDMDESLKEIPLLGRRRTPGFLEFLVRLEVAPGANRLESALERSLHRF